MCVIIFVPEDKPLPSFETLKACEDHNKDGAGYSYIKDDFVHWKKGVKLTSEEIMEDLAKIDGPKVIHYRIATAGGVKTPLCHPFPISKNVETFAEGRTKGGVLFHNGVWSNWKEVFLARYSKKIKGDWSDTRFIASLVNELGDKALELISAGNKFSVMTPTNIYRWGEWKEIDGVFFSNDIWKSYNYKSLGPYPAGSTSVGYRRICRHSACTTHCEIGEDYCAYHTLDENRDNTKYCGWEYCWEKIKKRHQYCSKHVKEGRQRDKERYEKSKALAAAKDSTVVPFVPPRLDSANDRGGSVKLETELATVVGKAMRIDDETGAITEAPNLIEMVESCCHPRDGEDWGDWE
jgi:hypothetical protein